jgi:hypothetical protein
MERGRRKLKRKIVRRNVKLDDFCPLTREKKGRTIVNINIKATILFDEYSSLAHRVPEVSEQHTTSIFRVEK